MKTQKILTALPLLAFFLTACDSEERYCGPIAHDSPAMASAMIALAPFDAIRVADQPILNLSLHENPLSTTETPVPPHLQTAVSPAYGSPHRLLQIDLLATSLDTYKELRVTWNPGQVYAYQLSSFEMRVPPSTTPGVRVLIDVYEFPTTPEFAQLALPPFAYGLIGGVSIWAGVTAPFSPLGPSIDIVDQAPFSLHDPVLDIPPPTPNRGGCDPSRAFPQDTSSLSPSPQASFLQFH